MTAGLITLLDRKEEGRLVTQLIERAGDCGRLLGAA